MNPETGLFKHRKDGSARERKWLSSISFKNGELTYPKTPPPSPPPSYEVNPHLSNHTHPFYLFIRYDLIKEMLASAEDIFASSSTSLPSQTSTDQSLFLAPEDAHMRWFLLSSDVTSNRKTTPPFQPRRYHLKSQDIHVMNPVDLGKSSSEPEVIECEDETTSDLKEDKKEKVCFHSPPKSIFTPTSQV